MRLLLAKLPGATGLSMGQVVTRQFLAYAREKVSDAVNDIVGASPSLAQFV